MRALEIESARSISVMGRENVAVRRNFGNFELEVWKDRFLRLVSIKGKK